MALSKNGRLRSLLSFCGDSHVSFATDSMHPKAIRSTSPKQEAQFNPRVLIVLFAKAHSPFLLPLSFENE